MRNPLRTALAAMALAGCAGAATGTLPSRTVEADYVIGGGKFSTGTRVTVAADAFREAGKVAVCAAWAAEGGSAMVKPHFDDVLEVGVLQLGGRNILRGFENFPRAPSHEALPGARAGCVLTSRDWEPQYAGLQPEIHFARIIIEQDEDEAGGGHNIIYFDD